MDKIQRDFVIFDHAHPEVFRAFVRFVLEAIKAGHRRHSADAILHRVRWEVALNGSHFPEKFKINNNFASRYARKFAKTFPRHAGFFQMRVLKSTGEQVAA